MLVNQIELLALDIDGVVTDGKVSVGAHGEETKGIAFRDLDALAKARREGLKLALDRADFRLAKPFAENVLSVDDGDVEANFAMAMFHFKSKNYSAAEKHLKKYLVRRPDEPAVLNNLAVVQLRLGRLDEAETNAVKALERFAGSPEIKSTLRSIREAKKGEKQ
jgi:predicted Zn-dependent protease